MEMRRTGAGRRSQHSALVIDLHRHNLWSNFSPILDLALKLHSPVSPLISAAAQHMIPHNDTVHNDK